MPGLPDGVVGVGLIDRMMRQAQQYGAEVGRGDRRQQTNVSGVFAAGDIVEALDHVSIAIGRGAVAATNVHNHLHRTRNDLAAIGA